MTINSFVSLVGFWAAVAMVCLASILALMGSMSKSSGSSIAGLESAGRGFGGVVLALFMAAGVLGVSSLASFLGVDGQSGHDELPALLQRLHGSTLMSGAATVAVLLWAMAFVATASAKAQYWRYVRQQDRLSRNR